MQDRPLEKCSINPDRHYGALERLLSIFCGNAKKFYINSADATLKAKDYRPFFAMLGFDEMPVIPKVQKRETYPRHAPAGAHPTHFLQWGAEIKGMDHVIFDVGDAGYLIRFDFKEAYTERDNHLFYQLDELTIWDYGTQYNLDCDRDGDTAMVDRVISLVRDTVVALNADHFDAAKNAFSRIADVIRDLDDLAEKMMQDHTQTMQQAIHLHK